MLGSIAFETEPLVSSFNGKNLRELLSGIWLLDRPGILMGNYVLKNVTFTDFSAPFVSYLRKRNQSKTVNYLNLKNYLYLSGVSSNAKFWFLEVFRKSYLE